MPKHQYHVFRVDYDAELGSKELKSSDKKLMDDFTIHSSFLPHKHTVEHHVYSIDGDLLESNHNYTSHTFSQDSEIASGKAAGLTLDPENDAKRLGYDTGGVVFVYNFLDDLFSESKVKSSFFIEEISKDRTEIRLLSTQLTDKYISDKVATVKDKFNSSSYKYDFRLNLKKNNLPLVVNIDTQEYKDSVSVILKLYRPLSDEVGLKSQVSLEEIVSNTEAYEIETTTTPDEINIPELRGPNFAIEEALNVGNPTQYFNYQELFNYPLTSSYREVSALFNEKGAQLSIDYTEYSNFAHFSSVEERLRNFKYKLDSIEAYQSSIDAISNGNSPALGITGSKVYYTDLINNIVHNFDHYDRYLYFESSSYSWPKTNNYKPYINQIGSATGSFWTQKLVEAQRYDNDNLNSLRYSIPSFLREDSTNIQYEAFIDMLAQHFDNIWVYTQAVTDKYDADNRLDHGISRDLVQDALRGFGTKLYSSNKSTLDLFNMFVGETYNTGSEQISTFISASDKIISEDNYRKEVYKRLYHNLPLLLKAKGTERGVKALINSFGIPTYNQLDGSISASNHPTGSHYGTLVRTVGGIQTDNDVYLSPISSSTSITPRIRVDNTGSIVTGNTLSRDVSIVERDRKYSQDTNFIEVGHSPSDDINKKIYDFYTSSVFNIDEYIGDPGFAYSSSYDALVNEATNTLEQIVTSAHNLQDFTRILKFYDNVVFKMVKDFLPARGSISTGIIIKPHVLERNKILQPQATVTRHEYTGSIDVVQISGSHTGEYYQADIDQDPVYNSINDYINNSPAYYTTIRKDIPTAYTLSVEVPDGVANYTYHNHETTKYDGEFSGSLIRVSNGEQNENNPYKYDSSSPVFFKYNFINGSVNCQIIAGAFIPGNLPTPTPTPTPQPPENTPTPTPIGAPTNTPTPTPLPTATPTPTPTPIVGCWNATVTNSTNQTKIINYDDCCGNNRGQSFPPNSSNVALDFCIDGAANSIDTGLTLTYGIACDPDCGGGGQSSG